MLISQLLLLSAAAHDVKKRGREPIPLTYEKAGEAAASAPRDSKKPGFVSAFTFFAALSEIELPVHLLPDGASVDPDALRSIACREAESLSRKCWVACLCARSFFPSVCR